MLKVSLLLCFLLINFLQAQITLAEMTSHRAFVFGASSSAYQVEGAADEDGRTPSILDTFAHAGNFDGATGDVACDEYHKYKEDVKLMADTGLEAYRFSISWSRLIPNGKGPVNPKGVQYYNNLIDELISNGIQPHVTLHHSDLPQALEDEYGGWVGREIVYSFLPFVSKFNASRRNKTNVIKQFYGCRKDFTAYADVCFKTFGDRVLYWTTMNEPNVFSLGGYDIGFLPPQRCSAPFGANCSRGNSSVEPYIAVHHLLLSHASAARLYKKKYQDKQHGFVGINVFAYWFVPLTKTIEDELAAQRALDFYTGWILNPLVFGDYPDVMKKNAGSRLPAFTSLESRSVKGSCDFLGINYYNTLYAKDYSSVLKKEKRDFNADSGIKIMSKTTANIAEPMPTPNLVHLVAARNFDVNEPLWTLHVNGSSNSQACGAGLVLTSLDKVVLEYALQLSDHQQRG
ncbi:beta glucosidase 11 [Prunus dulcis]|uniref:Beta glucosidase 11 n=1 Tax=Prunus dulcis TaxID=3755 RepID=A0A4Y1RMB5_PRUDU|nr:beta glucosidase 11 [Prunus dulcis]